MDIDTEVTACAFWAIVLIIASVVVLLNGADEIFIALFIGGILLGCTADILKAIGKKGI